jgi:hypothetical protein
VVRFDFHDFHAGPEPFIDDGLGVPRFDLGRCDSLFLDVSVTLSQRDTVTLFRIRTVIGRLGGLHQDCYLVTRTYLKIA